MSAAAPYLISKAIDPIFAISIGLAAAGVRINREEKEQGRSTQQTIEAIRRRWDLAWQGQGGQKSSKKESAAVVSEASKKE